MINDPLIPHLFRSEFSKITAVLGKFMGSSHIEAAEDIAGETFLAALETWPYKGCPPNPTAWLYTVAKNKAKNYMKRNSILAEKVLPSLQKIRGEYNDANIDFSALNIADSQLQMLFAICHPSLSLESQVGLALRILCGFGVDEIAHAFLTNQETIHKRLQRAKEKLRTENITIELPPSHQIQNRLDAVLKTLYLLFNEGYYSETNDAIIREDLCEEAIRLTSLLTQNDITNLPRVNALIALMCFQSSRLKARRNDNGDPVLYEDQDEKNWDRELVSKGAYYLNRASAGQVLSKYHLEAAIAYWHSNKQDVPEKWENILYLYNLLLQTEYSPIVALNRNYALSRVQGTEAAIRETLKLGLNNNPYYHSLLATLYEETDRQKAIEELHKACSSAKTSSEKKLLEARLSRLNKGQCQDNGKSF
jgi:RNA polymerase sigma-70 factor (ECF subfamily)